MCGIIGYIGNKATKNILLEGLKNLEYRGYDSSGVAILGDNIQIVKEVGKIENLKNSIAKQELRGNLGIGHTRWATHGMPTENNSHPHFSNDKKFAIVHNGIIENYLELKEKLQKLGYKFISDTDTEVIVHLYHYYYNGDMIDTLAKVIKDLEGSYAVCVLSEEHKDKFVVAKKDSPLIIGLGEDENFVASDMPAILKYTKNYYLLEDGEMALINKDKVTIYDDNKKIISKEVLYFDFDTDLAEKNGYEHFMLKEIFEQPSCIKKCVSKYIADNDVNFESFSKIEEIIKNTKNIHIVACGSAYHAGMIGKYAIENLARVRVNIDIASEFRYKNPILEKDDVCIIISQSGETADSLSALRLAKENGVKVISIVNVFGSSIARESDFVFYTLAGPEIAVATTKGYSTQVFLLYLFALKLAFIRGAISKDQFNAYISNIKQVENDINESLKLNDKIKDIANKYCHLENAFIVGRGIDYYLSLESSLKLKEISYIHSEAYASGELKHGSIALIDKDSLVIGIITDESLSAKTISNLKEVKARGAKVLVFAKEGIEGLEDVVDDAIFVPSKEEFFMGITGIIPMQLFSYYVAKERGCDIDMPKNLAKSVTVE